MIKQVKSTIILLLAAGLPYTAVAQKPPKAVAANNPQVWSVNPAQSIQAAIETAKPGDIISLEDGVYYQQITVNKALTIKAKNGGGATLSGAFTQGISFSPVSGTPGLYSSSVNWQVKWAMYGDRNLLDYGSLQKLKEFKILARRVKDAYPDGYPIPFEGFAWEKGKLYVRLLDEKDPNTVKLEISRASDSNSGITIAANNVMIDGLRIHIWHEAGIEIKEGIENTSVRNCFFDGCFRGIFAVEGKAPRKNLLVEYNEFSGKPFYDMRRIDTDLRMWAVLYDTNVAVRFLRSNMHGVTARHNYVYQVFDGIECKGGQDTTDVLSDFSYNVVRMVVDNSFEFDTDTRFMKARIHHNFLLDGYTILSFAPFQAGELLVDHNIFYTSPEQGLTSKPEEGLSFPPDHWLKNAYGAFAKAGEPYEGLSLSSEHWLKNCIHEYADKTIPQRNMTIVNNTVVLGDSPKQSSGLYTPCVEAPDKGFDFQNSIIENNIILIKKSKPYTVRGFTFSKYNLVYGSNYKAIHNPEAIHARPGFMGTGQKMDFHLSPTSAARGSGKGGKDLGAIPYGTKWQFPKPGPSWANTSNMPQRPTLPASIDDSWLGLQDKEH